jgi:Mg/Co/Ni transporter MgtE (contains CBS domain)
MFTRPKLSKILTFITLISTPVTAAATLNLPSFPTRTRPAIPSILKTTTTTTGTSAKMSPQSSEASALRELKEIIQKQKLEINALKSALNEKQSSITNKSQPHVHGHGAPTQEEDPNLYLSSPFYRIALQRVGWLALFLCSLSLTAVIMNGFEHTLSRQIELAYFVPLLAGHGGEHRGGKL